MRLNNFHRWGFLTYVYLTALGKRHANVTKKLDVETIRKLEPIDNLSGEQVTPTQWLMSQKASYI